jgi:multiple sugar transport system permease protein
VTDGGARRRPIEVPPAGKMRARELAVSDKLRGLLFVAPALLLLVAVLGFPAVAAVLQSFNLMWVEKPAFSLGAYHQLIGDPVFVRAAMNTALFVAATVAFHLLAGLGLALLLNLNVRLKWLFRVVALLPWTVPDVVAGLVWRFMVDPLAGFVNSAAIALGLANEPVDWLGDPTLARLCLILAEGWRAYPFIMLILLAGLQAIPRTQYEAAEMDGASAWQSFIYVTLPNLRTMLIIALVLDTIWECRLFGMVFSLTGGGPGDATQTLPLLVYRQNFEFFNTAYSAAIAVVLALAMFAIAIPYLRMTMKQKV